MEKKNFFKKVLKIFDPIDTVKFYINYIKKYKFLTVLVLTLALVPIARMGFNFQPLASYAMGDFLGDSMNNVSVSLSDGVGQYARNIYETLVPVGQCMAILYWMISIGELTMRTDFTVDLFVRQFIVLIGAVLVIGQFGYQICEGLLALSDALCGAVTGALSSAEAGQVTIKQEGDFTNVPITKSIVTLLSLLGLVVFKLFIQIQVAIIMWMRKIKIVLYTGLMPIGVADFKDGMTSTGAIYIKKYFALCLQGMIIVVVNVLFLALISNIFGDFFLDGGIPGLAKFLCSAIPVCLALLSLLKVSENIANEVLGVH